MAKKGRNSGMIALVAVVAVAVLIGAFFLFGQVQQSTLQSALQTTEITSAQNEFCANNPDIDLEWRIINEEASTASYLYGTVYIEELDASGNVVSLQEVSGGNVSTRTDSTNVLKCGKAHRLYIKTTQDAALVALPTAYELTSEQVTEDPVRIDIRTAAFSTVTMRVFDVINNDYMDTNSSTDNTTTDFEAPSASEWFNSITADTAETVGADADYEKRFEIKTASADSKFGSKTLMCIDNANDANSNDWETPVVTFEGSQLSDMMASLSSNDLLALTAYETCYDLGVSIDENIKKALVNMPTGAGVNPDYDWSVKFVGLGTYEDDDNPGELLTDIGFRTNAARTELATATPQRYYFDVS